jgi:small subunit ribosomal protein S17
VVAITPGYRRSKQKRHVVKHIIAPSGTPLESRPPIPTEDERSAADVAKKAAKDARRAARRGSSPATQSGSSEVETAISDVD